MQSIERQMLTTISRYNTTHNHHGIPHKATRAVTGGFTKAFMKGVTRTFAITFTTAFLIAFA